MTAAEVLLFENRLKSAVEHSYKSTEFTEKKILFLPFWNNIFYNIDIIK